MENDSYVLITGASSGIGADLARLFAKDGYSLVLVARRAEKLEELAQEVKEKYQTESLLIVKDLARSESPEEIYQELKSTGLRIDILVNNAGYGHHGLFTETSKEAELSMMQLNMVTLTHLTKLFACDMTQRKSGRILNVASTAAFQPGPLMAVYYATKAFVLSFSEALYSELKGTGVSVTCLCPGPTITGFQEAAEMENVRAFNLLTMSSMAVAKIGYRACMKGKRLVSAGLINSFFAFCVRITPRPMVLFIAKLIMTKVRH